MCSNLQGVRLVDSGTLSIYPVYVIILIVCIPPLNMLTIDLRWIICIHLMHMKWNRMILISSVKELRRTRLKTIIRWILSHSIGLNSIEIFQCYYFNPKLITFYFFKVYGGNVCPKCWICSQNTINYFDGRNDYKEISNTNILF